MGHQESGERDFDIDDFDPEELLYSDFSVSRFVQDDDSEPEEGQVPTFWNRSWNSVVSEA